MDSVRTLAELTSAYRMQVVDYLRVGHRASGKPAVLVTSGEHYGAAINLDFDYTRYLDTLPTEGSALGHGFRDVEAYFFTDAREVPQMMRKLDAYRHR